MALGTLNEEDMATALQKPRGDTRWRHKEGEGFRMEGNDILSLPPGGLSPTHISSAHPPYTCNTVTWASHRALQPFPHLHTLARVTPPPRPRGQQHRGQLTIRLQQFLCFPVALGKLTHPFSE